MFGGIQLSHDLVDRTLTILSDDRVSSTWMNAIGKDEVAKLVDDTYRKMQISGAPDLASKSQGLSDGAKVKLKDHMDMTRCLCGSSLPTDSMIKVCAVVFTTSLYSVHLDVFVVHNLLILCSS
ncbi:hypothetical protein SASPL_104414 [Salvia splendens]|uniref:Uncharacterized protein n=1 Tax=Salvia splendens TaxID=180675 RepID=A0A8X9A7P4_SALSN|nr:hypothetical protein SASPL_104414 [Salvia splendens]